MARHTFFSFHYERDVWRASQVKNSWITQDRKAAGFWNSVEWEEVQRNGDYAIKKWIRDQIKGTSVTVVLIGAQTSNRDYVKYELQHSNEVGNGILGIYIHQKKDSNGYTDVKGDNHFGQIFKDKYGNDRYFYELYKTYDWVDNDGYNNMGKWIEEAARNAGR